MTLPLLCGPLQSVTGRVVLGAPRLPDRRFMMLDGVTTPLLTCCAAAVHRYNKRVAAARKYNARLRAARLKARGRKLLSDSA